MSEQLRLLNSITQIGPHYDMLNIPHNLTINYSTYNFDNYGKLTMDMLYDAIVPEYLEFELPANVSFENFKEMIYNVCLEMEIGRQRILSIPLRFIMHLKNFEICDNKIYINIPFELFCNEIKLVSLRYHNVDFILKNTQNQNQYIQFCKLIVKGILYNNTIRNNLIENSREEIIQQISSIELTSQEPVDEFTYSLPFNCVHKGFYIESENVNNINEITLKFNDINRLTYNRFLIRTKCVKINANLFNENLLYLPMNYNKSPFDRTPEGFEGSENLSRLDNIKITIKLDASTSKICIYGLSLNILKTVSGMGCLGFSYSPSPYCDNYRNYRRSNQNNTNTQSVQTIVNNVTIRRVNLRRVNLIYKQITDQDKLQCCIDHEDIANESHYMSCIKCHNNFNEASLELWFQNNTRKTCPMCRETWTDFNVYINQLDPPSSA